MAIEVTTKDCTALTDAELGDMADLVAGRTGWEAGLLSKEAEKWVLVSQAFVEGQLRGFVFTTLERIGGTPAVVIGLGTTGGGDDATSVLNGLMSDQFHKALMAFPDEDVVVAARMQSVAAFEAFTGLDRHRPWPGERVNGEDRAWGRRLAKRYGSVSLDERALVAAFDGPALVLDHESATAPEHEELTALLDTDDRHLLAFGWAMAEFLEPFTQPVG